MNGDEERREPSPSVNAPLEDVSFLRAPRWQVALILLLNALTIPFIAVLFYVQIQYGPSFGLNNYALEAGMGIYNAQIYLLAFWMAFGGWPKRWRRLWTSLWTMCLGLLLGAGICSAYLVIGLFDFGPGSSRMYWLMLFGTPLMFVLIIWFVHLLVLFPQWYFGIVIDFQQVRPLAPRPTRQLGVIHYLTLMLYVAIPLGVIRFLSNADEMLNIKQVSVAMIPFVLLLITLAPISLSLLVPQLSMRALVLSFAWFALATVCLFWAPFLIRSSMGAGTLFGTGVAATLNLILWRSLGLRWLPYEAATMHVAPIKSVDAPDWN